MTRREKIKIIVFKSIVIVVLIHGIYRELTLFDQSNHPSDFGGSYVIKNSDSTSTAVAFSVIPSIIDIDDIDF